MTKLIQFSTLLLIILFSMHSNAMQYFVRTADGKSYAIEVDGHFSILNLKEQMAVKTGIPVEKQRIIHGGRETKNNEIVLQLPDVLKIGYFHLIKRVDTPSTPEISYNLDQERNDFNTTLAVNDYEMSHVIVQSIINSSLYTIDEKNEVRSWLKILPK